MTTQFKREERYVVFKIKDLEALTTSECEALYRMGTKILNYRKATKRPPFKCVCVEHDWPEYEMVWAAIEKRVAGGAVQVEPNKLALDALDKLARLGNGDCIGNSTGNTIAAQAAAEIRAALEIEAVPGPTIKQMVNRFLCWPLPKDFSPDCGISFKRESDYCHPTYGRQKNKPIGTNLFTADQARAMFEYVTKDVA